MLTRSSLSLSFPLLLVATALWAAPPRIEVVVPEGSRGLERLAGLELQSSLSALYGEKVAMRSRVTESALRSVYLGGVTGASSESEFHLSRHGGDGGREIITLGAARPHAMFWAACELTSLLGVRHALDGDVMPSTPSEWPAPSERTGREYATDLKTRLWSLRLDSPLGPGSWSLEEHRRSVRQLAKNRFTGVVLEARPWQPFVHYTIGGHERATGDLWRRRFPIDSDSAGKAAFHGADEFESPAFAGRSSYAEKRAAAQSLARGVFQEARRYGMDAALSIAPFEFPLEFRDVLSGLYADEPVATVLPAARLPSREKVLAKAIRARVASALATYRDVSTLILDLTHLPSWDRSCEAAWGRLAERGCLGKGAALGAVVAGSERLMAEVSALELLSHVLSDEALLARDGRPTVELLLAGISPTVAARLASCFPDGTRFLVTTNEEVPAAIAARTLRALELGGADSGALPRLATRTAEAGLQSVRTQGLGGYVVRSGLAGDLDLAVYYLAQASFDKNATRHDAADSFWRPLSDEASRVRLLRGFEQIEDATDLIDAAPIDLRAPLPRRAPSWLEKATELYGSSLIEMHRSRFGIHSTAQHIIMYFAKRTEFAGAYLAALGSSATAPAETDTDTRIETLETAIESLYDAADAVREVIRTGADRGLIAVLNESSYRELIRRVEALEEE